MEGIERGGERGQLAPVAGQTLAERMDGLQVGAVLEPCRIGREHGALPTETRPFEP